MNTLENNVIQKIMKINIDSRCTSPCRRRRRRGRKTRCPLAPRCRTCGGTIRCRPSEGLPATRCLAAGPLKKVFYDTDLMIFIKNFLLVISLMTFSDDISYFSSATCHTMTCCGPSEDGMYRLSILLI